MIPGSTRFSWNPSAWLHHLAHPWFGKYPYKTPLYVRTGTISAVDSWRVKVTFDDETATDWVPFDETGTGFRVGQLLTVTFHDSAMTKPYPFFVPGARGGYDLEMPHYP